MKHIKKELFFIRKLFRERYGFRKNLCYFKNRFWGQYLLSGIPRINCGTPDDSVEVRILCQESDIWMLVWALKSFLYHSQLCPRIIIHDDGSITRKTALLLEDKFPMLTVLSREAADKKFANRKDIPSFIKEYRNAGHPLVKKLTDIFLFSEAPLVMILDSDILFYKRPQEIIDFIDGRIPHDALILGSHPKYGSYYVNVSGKYKREKRMRTEDISCMNSGLILYKNNLLSVQQLIGYFSETKREQADYFVEMDGWICLISQLNFGFLPYEKYHTKGPISDITVAKHFTGPRRHELYAYGIDEASAAIK